MLPWKEYESLCFLYAVLNNIPVLALIFNNENVVIVEMYNTLEKGFFGS
jgi:hypothetical protein